MLDWLIIGGGPQGRFIAASLAHANASLDIAVLDPAPPLAAWCRRADACGMAYLRSSNAHHLGIRANSLRRFAAQHGFDSGHTLGHYQRPSRALFEAHAQAELEDTASLIPATAQTLEAHAKGWCVHTDTNTAYTARRVVLATGPGAPYRPPGLSDAEHVFDAGFSLGAPHGRTVIVGGGITGAQLALRGVEAGHTLCWVTRTPPRPADFDSDPRYAGPRGMAPFLAATLDERHQLLHEARYPGTLPPDILARMTAALSAGQLSWQRADVVHQSAGELHYADGRRLAVDRVILATGFDTAARPDSLFGRCIREFEWATDADGHLMLNGALEAAPGLHIVGRPASLQLGPMAGNIKGARMAGERLAALVPR